MSDRNHGLSLALAAAALGLIGCATELESAPAAPPAQLDADAEGAPLAALGPQWDALVRETGAAPSVRWSQHGTPMSLFGTLASQASGATVSDARRFLAGHAELLQLGLDQLADDASVQSPLGTHVTFSQRFEGVRVVGGEVKVHFNRAGQIIGVNNTTVPGVSLSTVPAISAERALAAALAVATGDRGDVAPPAAPELVIYADAGAPQLAYRAVVPTNKATLEVFIDAHTGAAIGEPKDLNQYLNGTGQVFKDNAVVATQNNNLVDSNDAAAAVPTAAYSSVTLQGLNGNNRLDGQFASGSATRSRALGTNNSFVFQRNTTAFSETMAYFHIDFAQRYIQSLGFTNVNNRQLVFSVDRSTADNSSYSPSTKQITYGTGGVDDAEDGEVIVHE
ncbi:MAG TPA: PepSY domain-containing protein, partial [Kofleriaceae bacterium]|nr:PepSY domain-containing protein [Kofleriaceae bacterium]